MSSTAQYFDTTSRSSSATTAFGGLAGIAARSNPTRSRRHRARRRARWTARYPSRASTGMEWNRVMLMSTRCAIMNTTAPAPRGDHIERLIRGRHSYPDYPYDEVLIDAQAAAQRSGSVGKSDIGALMLWKRLNLSAPWTRDLNNMPDRDVREITSAAIELARDDALPIPDAASAARKYCLPCRDAGRKAGMQWRPRS